ncbi:phosphopantetheine-binding protein [Ruminiclostridium papyrosolvens]|uniref:Acyl carrier protein n=1 Tax=Ruminiclostridium papyrosolvens C7 TaxID=1330534 RepID=U4R205_9FIRM|nr:phosphopantetheine-binding protein [Ruminiclostridium papyrosolvens]EPR12218.1 acyl carrier protein [Ruminiclostridium papyrosolvens C7]
MNDIYKKAEEREKLCREIKSMMVEQLDIEMDPEFITNDQPIFGRGLELDSIDALELAVGIYDKFEISVTDDNTTIFSSVNTMADYIEVQKLENEG